MLSDWLEGEADQCPTDFNAARYCVGPGKVRPAEKAALLAVDAETGASRCWTFGDAERAVRRAAGALKAAGVRQGDRVVILLGDVPEFPFAYFGAIAAGAVATPLSSQLSRAEIESIVQDAEPRVLLAGPELDIEAPGVVRMQPELLLSGDEIGFAGTTAEDPALLVFTSGSSGRPKGVLHAQRAFWARRSMHAGWHGIGPEDRVMHAGAFNWTFTLGVGLADTWSVGATAILNSGARTPEVWPQLALEHRPTVFAAAPAVFRRILKYGTDLGPSFSSLRHAVTAGENLAPAIADGWQGKTGKLLLEALGMSEVSTYISTPPDRTLVPRHAGWPQPGRRVAILGDDGKPLPFDTPGRLAVHAGDQGLMLGYWRQPDLTQASYHGDWFLTGDLATMRPDGAIAYAGRRDDQMNAQGFRVDPQEVEAALMRHEGVAECAVTALEVGEGLSVIAAWIVPAESMKLQRVELLEIAHRYLADYKMPRELFLVKSLPHTPNGKLIRRGLGDVAADRLS